eukprot:442706_1
MAFYRNQEVQITGKFVGIADDGKVQVKLKGLDHVQFEVDPKYVNAAGAASAVPQTIKEEPRERKKHKRKSKKLKSKPEPETKEEPDPWGDSDDNEEDDKEPEPKPEPEPEKEEEPEPKADASAGGILDASELSLGEERFHKKHKFKTISLENGNSIIRTTEDKMVMCAFGSVECGEAGKIYHWKIQILEGKDVNVGVIFSDQCKKNRKDMWWITEEGYSYWGDDGQIYHSDKYKKYGDTYAAGDTIDCWLNLKKYHISFAKNDNKYGKAFKVNKEKSYRFGVGLSGHPHTSQLLQFDIQ